MIKSVYMYKLYKFIGDKCFKPLTFGVASYVALENRYISEKETMPIHQVSISGPL